MKFSHKLFKLGFAFLCAFLVIGCTQTDDSIDNREMGYGYVQFKLYKKAAAAPKSRAAGELEYLRDAHKITFSLRFEGQIINQTVLVEESDPSIAEFGLRTEKLKLMVGEYELLSYIIYNAVDEKLPTSGLENPVLLTVEQSKLLVQPIDIPTKLRGKIQFTFTKDLSGIVIKKKTRSEDDQTREYTFEQIARVDVVLRNQEDMRSLTISDLPCKFVRTDDGKAHLQCDSLVSIIAGDYQLETYMLWDSSKRPLGTTDCRDRNEIYTIEDNETYEADVKVVISPEALYILDYLALKKIYDDMNGEQWSWNSDGFPTGATWNFDKEVDLWYEQPGVMIHPNGRVAALNLGALNPKGPLSPAIGQLDAMLDLLLGTHNDIVPESEGGGGSLTYGTHPYSVWSRLQKGDHLAKYRDQMCREELLARNIRPAKSELFDTYEKYMAAEIKSVWNARRNPKAFYGTPAQRPYDDVYPGYYTNHITSLPDEIGNLVNLETLFIANGEISEIPETIRNCTSLSDIEIYNCQKMLQFPTKALSGVPNLVLLNIANNPQMPAEVINKGIEDFFASPGAAKLQILYANGNKLTVWPESARNLKHITMIDVANNDIHTVHPMGTEVAPAQLFMDNNKITELPDNLCNLEGIEEIGLANNYLTEFPNIFTSQTEDYIKSLDVSFNKIRSIAGYDNVTQTLVPDKNGNTFRGIKATTLILAGNMLNGGFPAAFSLSGSDVSRFNLSYNNLDSIGAKGLKGLKFTTALDLSSNNIEKAPLLKDILIGQEMPFLTGVDLSMNRFQEFPTTLFNGYGITSFFFSSQMGVLTDEQGRETDYRCFTKWPKGIEQYPGLRVLKVDNNDIRVIEAFPETLNFLAIDGNENISVTIPSNICARIISGSFGFVYESTQKGIKGCPELGVDKE